MEIKVIENAWEEIARMQEKAAKHHYNKDREKSHRLNAEAKAIRERYLK